MTTPANEGADLAAKVAALEAQLDELKAQIGAPAAPANGSNGHHGSAEPVELLDPVTDRRNLLRRAGIGAAAAAAGGAALALSQASPAAAANGNSIIIGNNGGSSNTGSATTELRTSAKTGTMGLFVVQDGTLGLTLFPAAIQGMSTGGVTTHGVYGYTDQTSGYGVVGVGQAAGVFASGSAADISFGGLGSEPSQGSPNRGGMTFTANDNLWFCPTNAAGSWTHLAGPSVAGSLHLLPTTTRIYDTRPGTVPLAVGPKTKYQDGTIRTLDATGNSSGVPTAARGVMISATATNTNSGGFFSFWDSGAFPGNSNLNWAVVNSTVAVTTVVACGANATFQSRMAGVGGSDLVVDVIGYYL